ncbi:hypothetical protein GF339_22605, partial [candidate division KSB3 bacterium]|nr:hypothetical protein [candidate division KSB3 bacterium]MBD3327395.1 hypothetical protein [candidate division KSB3 bacterium]
MLRHNPKYQPSYLTGIPGILLVMTILTILSAIAYHNVNDNFFSCDDFVWLKNAIITVRHPLNILTQDIAGWFRPLGHLTFAINYLLFGVHNPVAYVIVSIGFHILTSLLVFILTAMLLNNRYFAFWAAAFFAVQHVHWEAVAWSSIVAEVLAALWFLLTIICFLQWRERSAYSPRSQIRRHPGRAYYILAHIAMVLSFLSAESAVTLPAMLLLADLFYARNVWRHSSLRAISAHFSLWALWLIYVAYELWIQWNGHHLGAGGDYAVNLQFFLTLFRSLLAYIFPKPLLLFMLQSQSLLAAIFSLWIGLVLLGLLTLLFIKMPTRDYPHALYAGLWTIITLLPFCGFTRFTIIDSRQFYLSSVGISILFSLFLKSFSHNIQWGTLKTRLFKKSVLALGILGIFTWNILEIWHEDILFEDYAREGEHVLQTLRRSYPDFPENARLYFSGLHTPPQFLADMLFVYYALPPARTSYVSSEKIRQLQ